MEMASVKSETVSLVMFCLPRGNFVVVFFIYVDVSVMALGPQLATILATVSANIS